MITENGPFGAGSQLASFSLPGDSFWTSTRWSAGAEAPAYDQRY
jgi:hypothetical protein